MRQLGFEILESRLPLASDFESDDVLHEGQSVTIDGRSASLRDSHLVATGSDGGEAIVLSADGLQLGGTRISLPDPVSSAVLHGMGGPDRLEIRDLNIPATLVGSAGKEILIGGSGNDRIIGNGDQDIVSPGAGVNEIDAPAAYHVDGHVSHALVVSVWPRDAASNEEGESIEDNERVEENDIGTHSYFALAAPIEAEEVELAPVAVETHDISSLASDDEIDEDAVENAVTDELFMLIGAEE